MSNVDYDLVKRQFATQLSTLGQNAEPSLIRYIAGELGIGNDLAERLVADLCEQPSKPRVHAQTKIEPTNAAAAETEKAPEPAAPFLLIRLGEDLRPGAHLSPEFHLIHSSWDGDAQVETMLHGALDCHGWNNQPRLTKDQDGYWIFHQALALTFNGQPCPSGEYRLEFECHFRESPTQTSSSWRGWMHFRVFDHGNSGQTLEVVSDGQGLVNLHGLDLKRFNRVRFEARDNSLVNLQSFLTEIEKTAEPEAGGASQPSMAPVKLLRIPPKPVTTRPRSIRSARFDLPGERRILLFAQDSVILGRNRPDPASPEPTDIALRMLPRSAFHDSLTRNISKQHLAVTVRDSKVTLQDPRRTESRDLFPARVNRLPLNESVRLPHVNRPISYTTIFGDALTSSDRPPQLGLEIHTFDEPEIAHEIRQRFQVFSPCDGKQEPWLREQAGLDALLIERAANTDELNRKEAYLLVLGAVLIGSDAGCPIRISHPRVREQHAVLSHWNGHFLVMPVGEAPVVCGNKRLAPGECGSLYSGSVLRLADLELTLDKPLQLHLE